MSHILGFWVCAHICPHICIRICLPDRESTSRGRQGAPSWSPPSLNSKLSQFSTDPLPRSRTLPCSQNWIQTYTNGWRGGGRFLMPQNGANPHFTFKRAISKLCFFLLLFLVLYCSGLAPCGGLNPADCRWHQHPPTTLSPFLLFGCCCVYLLCLFEFVPRCTGSLKGFTELISN